MKETAIVFNNLGKLYYKKANNIDLAEDCYQESIILFKTLLELEPKKSIVEGLSKANKNL